MRRSRRTGSIGNDSMHLLSSRTSRTLPTNQGDNYPLTHISRAKDQTEQCSWGQPVLDRVNPMKFQRWTVDISACVYVASSVEFLFDINPKDVDSGVLSYGGTIEYQGVVVKLSLTGD
eukprot:g37984.t1